MSGLITTSGIPLTADTSAAEYNAGYLVTLDITHHKIHEGKEFRLYDYDAEVDAAVPKYWLAVSPPSTRVHLQFSISAGLPGLLEGFGASTVSANGTLLNSANADGNNAAQAEHLFYKDPTVTDDGILAFVEFIGTVGVNPVGASGGAFQTGREIIAPSDSVLLLKFTAEANDTPISVAAWWYEVPDNSTG